MAEWFMQGVAGAVKPTMSPVSLSRGVRYVRCALRSMILAAVDVGFPKASPSTSTSGHSGAAAGLPLFFCPSKVKHVMNRKQGADILKIGFGAFEQRYDSIVGRAPQFAEHLAIRSLCRGVVCTLPQEEEVPPATNTPAQVEAQLSSSR